MMTYCCKRSKKRRLQPNSELRASVVVFNIKELHQLHSYTANEGFYHPFKQRVEWRRLKFEGRSKRNFTFSTTISFNKRGPVNWRFVHITHQMIHPSSQWLATQWNTEVTQRGAFNRQTTVAVLSLFQKANHVQFSNDYAVHMIF